MLLNASGEYHFKVPRDDEGSFLRVMQELAICADGVLHEKFVEYYITDKPSITWQSLSCQVQQPIMLIREFAFVD